MLKKIFSVFLNIFKKEKRFSCIIWDGKTLSYLNLTNKEIKTREEENKNIQITKKEEIL